MQLYNIFIELLNDLSELSARHLIVSINSQFTDIHHFLTVGNPSSNKKFKRLISLLCHKSRKYYIFHRYINTPMEDIIFIGISEHVKNYDISNGVNDYDVIAGISIIGDETALIDLNKLSKGFIKIAKLYTNSLVFFL